MTVVVLCFNWLVSVYFNSRNVSKTHKISHLGLYNKCFWSKSNSLQGNRQNSTAALCKLIKNSMLLLSEEIRVRFFKKIQDRILKSGRIRKWILRFFTKEINPRSFGSCCVKGTEESTSRVDSSVPLTRHDPRDLGLICSEKKHKIRFRILLHSRIQSWIFL